MNGEVCAVHPNSIVVGIEPGSGRSSVDGRVMEKTAMYTRNDGGCEAAATKTFPFMCLYTSRWGTLWYKNILLCWEEWVRCSMIRGYLLYSRYLQSSNTIDGVPCWWRHSVVQSRWILAVLVWMRRECRIKLTHSCNWSDAFIFQFKRFSHYDRWEWGIQNLSQGRETTGSTNNLSLQCNVIASKKLVAMIRY